MWLFPARNLHPTFFEMRRVLPVVLPHLWRKIAEQKSPGYIPLFCLPDFPVPPDRWEHIARLCCESNEEQVSLTTIL